MAFTIDTLRKGHKPAHVFIGGKKFEFTIDPNYLNQAVMDEYREASEDQDYDTMAAIFANIVVEWDLVEGEEEGAPMVEITGEVLRTLPLTMLNRLWDEIASAVSPKSRTKKGS